MRRLLLPLTSVLALAVAAPIATASATENQQAGTQGETEYVVVYDDGATDAARAAIAASGGEIVKENAEVGVATVRSSDAGFASEVATQAGVEGVAHNSIIGSVPEAGARTPADRDAVEKAGRDSLTKSEASTDSQQRRGRHHGPKAEPLADLQWDMEQIHATADGSYRVEQGDKRVLVGIIDTGVDGTHPDIAPNFSHELSRNFTTDIPTDANGAEIDGPCEVAIVRRPAERGRRRPRHPRRVDDRLADQRPRHRRCRAEGDAREPARRSGLGLLLPAAHGRRADLRGRHRYRRREHELLRRPVAVQLHGQPGRQSPADQAEQRTIITAVQRALDYAHRKGVTLIAAAGNEASTTRRRASTSRAPTSPSEPGEEPYSRDIPPSCISDAVGGRPRDPGLGDRPVDTQVVLLQLRPGYIDVAAPGGDAYDTPDGSRDITGVVLAAYPYNVGVALVTSIPTR